MSEDRAYLRLPPELWRHCLRWATLPGSGRHPTDLPATTLDPWPKCCPRDVPSIEGPHVAYGFEQRHLYPTKRALMLVCSMWADIAVEFMFESLFFNMHQEQELIQTLQDETRGPRLARWVRRIDIRSHDPFTLCQEIARLHLPNLQMQCVFEQFLEPLPIIPSHHSLHTIVMDYTLLSSLPSSYPDIFRRVRALTIIVKDVEQEKPPQIDDLVCANLSQLTIIAVCSTAVSVINCISAIGSTSHPNLTHLALHLYTQHGEHTQPLLSWITRIGVQLRHLTITALNSTNITADELRKILLFCPNITELVISAPKDFSSTNAVDYAHPKLQTLGLPLEFSHDKKTRSAYSCVISTFGQKDAFPMMEAMRITTAEEELSGEGLVWNMEVAEWLRPHAVCLLEAGIALEDGHGEDIRQSLKDHKPLLCKE